MTVVKEKKFMWLKKKDHVRVVCVNDDRIEPFNYYPKGTFRVKNLKKSIKRHMKKNEIRFP
jgi:hypothetical protein